MNYGVVMSDMMAGSSFSRVLSQFWMTSTMNFLLESQYSSLLLMIISCFIAFPFQLMFSSIAFSCRLWDSFV